MQAPRHTVERLESALDVARRMGYGVREEWLGGSGGGACVLKGRRWLFLDLAQPPEEQLAVVEAAINLAASEPLGRASAP
jgi:hypothetical protein